VSRRDANSRFDTLNARGVIVSLSETDRSVLEGAERERERKRERRERERERGGRSVCQEVHDSDVISRLPGLMELCV